MKLDLTTGEATIPREIEYIYPCIFSKEDIKTMAYPLETILAEKYETIIRRNLTTTWMRDFYNLYTLYKLKKDEIDYEILKEAIEKTSKIKRKSGDNSRLWGNNRGHKRRFIPKILVESISQWK